MTSNKILILITGTSGDIEQTLPHPLRISSDWKVAIKEISIPVPLFNISDKETIIINKNTIDSYTPLIIKIKDINYVDAADMIERIQDIITEHGEYKSKFYFNRFSHKIEIEVNNNEFIEFTGRMSDILSLPAILEPYIYHKTRGIDKEIIVYPKLDTVHYYLLLHQFHIRDHKKLYKDEIISYGENYYVRCKPRSKNDVFYD